MSSTHDQAVEVLNACKLAADGAAKVDQLRSLLELAVRKEPALLPEFLPEVLEMQVDPSPAVRRFLPDMIDGAVAANPCPPVLAACLACLRGLLADAAAATARRALQSCYATFRAAYALVALRGGVAAEAEVEALRELWGAACALKLAAAALVAGEGGGAAASNDGVRQAAARFLEQAVMLLTAEVVPAVAGISAAPTPPPPGNVVAGKAAVVRDAETALSQLVALLRQRLGEGEGGVSAQLAVTAVRSAAGIAQQRPQFMGRLLPPLLALANSDAVQAAAGDAAAGGAGGGAGGAAAGAGGARGAGAAPGSAASVAAALKGALLALARSSAPGAKPWKRKIAAALEALGAGGELQPEDGRAEKRPHAAVGEPSKRPRLDGSHQPAAAAAAAPTAAPAVMPASEEAPLAAPPAPALPAVAGLSAVAPATATQLQSPPTPPDQLAKVLTVLQALVAAKDATMLAGVVGSLQPAVLADVVMAYMQRLPPQHSLPPDGAPFEPWLLQLLDLIAAQAPLQQVPAPAQQTQQLPQQPQQPQAAALQPPPPPPQQQQQHLGPSPEPEAGPAAAAPPAKPAAASAAPAAPLPRPSAAALAAAFRLEPVPLTEGQQRGLWLSAVLRILRTDKTSRQGLRTSLVAKLAADAEAGSQAPAILQQLVQGIASGSGGSEGEGGARGELEVALQWLNLLYARDCQPSDALPAGSAEVGEEAGSSSAGAAAGLAARQRWQQRQQAGGRASSPGGGGASQYERTLLQLLRGLQAALPPSSRLIARVLLEVPALPQPTVCRFLEQLSSAGPDWCTLALLAARDVILQRGPSRQAVLGMVLDACASPTSDTRSKAVRLVANRLFPDPGMAPIIEQAARQRLDAMLPAPAPKAEAAAEEAAAAGAAAGAAQPAAEGTETQPAASTAAQGAPAGTTAAAAAAAVAVKKEEGAQEGSPAGSEPGPAQAQAAGPTAAEAAQLCALYCALCTKKHSLLRRLFEVYAQTSEGGRAAIQRNAGGLAKTLGAGAGALLAVVTDPPAGSLPLVLQMLHVLTETAVPPPLLVAACLQLHEGCRDARVLVPALRGLDRAGALRLLPALLDLQPEQLRPALQRLVAPLPAAGAAAAGGGGEGQQQQQQQAPAAPAVVSPEELLSALHTLDASRDPGLLRKMMQAVTVCISSPALFPPEALAACINQLLTRVPLPQLFMRTVIQTVAAAPRLRAFVVGVLRQLAAKQIWKDATQWKGWLMCMQQTVPDSFPALLGLPPDALGSALKAMPQNTKQQLLAFAEQGSVAVPGTTLTMLKQEVQPPAAEPAG